MTDMDVPDIAEMSSVTSIEHARQRKARPSSAPKLKAPEICRMLAGAVSQIPTRLPKFPEKYLVLEPKPGVTIPLKVGADDSVTVTLPKAIANDVLRYCNDIAGIAILPKSANDVAEYFLSTHPPIDPNEIAITRWADEPGLTYRRLPWRKEMGDAPTWEDLLSRMSNSAAFIDWVGSLFFEKAFLHNYVWIYGEGGDGKGAINRFLERVFDTAYRSKMAPTIDRNGAVDKFWAYNLIGARLAVFPDCEQASFTTTGFFKSLTGGDPVEVEAKKQMGFTVRLNTRYMILANVKPAITSAKSNIRRIIYCEMEPTEQDWGGIEAKLWEEGGYFLSYCIETYLSKYPAHGPIATDQSALLGVIDENEQHLENFFDEYFLTTEPTGYATAKELKVAAEAAWPRSRKTYREFLAWLKRVHQIECQVTREGTSTERRYYGMGKKRPVSGVTQFGAPDPS